MSDSAEKTPSTAEFKKNLAEVLELLNQGNLPIIVAGDGQVESVLQDAESQQRALDAVEHEETAEGIRRGFADVEARHPQPLEEALRAVTDRHPDVKP